MKCEKFNWEQNRFDFDANMYQNALSQLAHERFTTPCDRNVLASHELSHRLHDV